jgi:hypothetical protein
MAHTEANIKFVAAILPIAIFALPVFVLGPSS